MTAAEDRARERYTRARLDAPQLPRWDELHPNTRARLIEWAENPPAGKAMP